MAPALACALLTLAMWGSRSGLPAGSRPVIVESNRNDTPVELDGFANKQNCWSSVTFDSTNHSRLGSIMDSFRH